MLPAISLQRRVVNRLQSTALHALSDADLLSRFADSRDETAFAVIVERHGPLTFGACRRRLANSADAEDAFQAVFLALSQNAGSIRKRASLVAWLYGACHRVCLKINRGKNRARRISHIFVRNACNDPLARLTARELMTIIGDELACLPDRVRLPVELCLIEGMTLDEAAKALGWSVFSVKGRLQRGRAKLKRRLASRGVAIGVAFSAVSLESASAGLPGSMVTLAIASALGGVTPQVVATLAETATQSSSIFVRSVAAAALATSVVIVSIISGSDRQAVLSPPQLGSDPKPKSDAAAVDAYGDPLPLGAVARLGSTRFQTGMWPKSIVPSPDGSKIATIAWNLNGDRYLTIWDAAGSRVREVILPGIDIASIHWLGDGRGFALAKVAMADYAVWEFTDPNAKPPSKEDRSASNTTGNGSFQVSAISPDGKLVAAGQRAGQQGNEGKLEIWELAPGRRIRNLKRIWDHDSPDVFLDLAFTSDAKQLISVSQKQDPWYINPDPGAHGSLLPGKVADTVTVTLRDVATGKQSLAFDAVAGVYAFSRDRRTLYAGGTSGEIHVYDLKTGKRQSVFAPFKLEAGESKPIRFLSVTPDEKTLLAVRGMVYDSTNTVVALDTSSGRSRWQGGNEVSVHVEAVAVTPDSKRFVFGNYTGAIVQCETESGRLPKELCGSVGGFGAIWAEADGQSVITSDHFYSSIRRWDLASGRDSKIRGANAKARDLLVDFAPNGKWVLCRSRFDGAEPLAFFDFQAGQRGNELTTVGERFQVYPFFHGKRVAWLPDGSVVVIASLHPFAVRFDRDGKEIQRYIMKKGDDLSSVACAPDGKIVALCGRSLAPGGGFYESGWAQFFDADSGKVVRTLNSRTHFSQLAYTADGSRVLISGSVHQPARPVNAPKAHLNLGDAITCYDLHADNQDAPFDSPSGIEDYRGTTVIAITRNGYQFAVVDNDYTITVYETASGKIRHRFAGHRNIIEQLVFTPDGTRLISTSRDRTGLVWKVSLADSRRRSPNAAPLTRDQWDDLASSDAEVALSAISALVANPTTAVAIIKENLKPAAGPTNAELEKLIAGVASTVFSERELATEGLDRIGAAAAPFVRQSFSKIQSPEGRQRLARFLIRHDQLGRLTGPRLRERRAVELLETLATTDAIDLLRKLSLGDLTPLAKDCADALKRIEQRRD